jgi:Holliday junction resolvase RusA-like endonuclease
MMSANGSVGHWRTRQKKHDIDRDTAWAAAKHAGWKFVPGRVKLTITLCYTGRYRVDADNLAYRCKGMIDGLKGDFFTDDSTEWLVLDVRAQMAMPGVKELHIELESIET